MPIPNTLQPGQIIDRIGHKDYPNGNFAAPVDTPFDARALPPDRLGPDYVTTRYEVVAQPLPEVRQGPIMPWFEQLGGGTQYFFPAGIQDAVEKATCGS
ncbi:TNT domain-containing protein [Brooklawnia cerclae]|uniref:TNT domain-containing protein n=1 Tax=Brooklawnia cerclae TaxID=349934 RepID=UPI00141E222D